MEFMLKNKLRCRFSSKNKIEQKNYLSSINSKTVLNYKTMPYVYFHRVHFKL